MEKTSFIWRMGDAFHKKKSFLKKVHFVLLHLFFYVITAPKTLKGSHNKFEKFNSVLTNVDNIVAHE